MERRDDGYGSDPFADMDDRQAFQLEEEARARQAARGKRPRDEPMEALPRKRQAIAQGQQETVPLTRSLRASSEDYGGDPFEGFSTRDLEALERENPSTRRSSSGSGSFRGDVEEPPVSTNHRQRAGSEDSELEYVIPNALGETQQGDAFLAFKPGLIRLRTSAQNGRPRRT
ncbi:hypothetical protein [Agrobacterium burrii]